MTNNKKVLLMILDGWGIAKEPSVSAIDKAKTPYIDSLYNKHANSKLITYGAGVGLPEGQMGNSEVGHMNLGAGRIVYQDFAKINLDIDQNKFKELENLKTPLKEVQKNKKKLHLIGLVSNGGVHSHINHLEAILKLAGEMNDRKQLIINSEEFKAEFSDVVPIVNQSERIVGSNLAEIYSVAMDKLTGRGLNYAILDDLVTAQSAAKQKEELRNALRFLQNTLPSRMNKSAEDTIINIAQRLGPGDVSDFIITNLGHLYQTVKLQAIAEEDIAVVFPCSGEVWNIKQGDLAGLTNLKQYLDANAIKDFKLLPDAYNDKGKSNFIPDNVLNKLLTLKY